MSKTKYVLAIPDDIPLNPQFLVVYGTEPIGNKIRTYTIEMDETEELDSDYINEHFSDLQDTAYRRGLEDGKAVNDKGCEGCGYESNKKSTYPCSECAYNFKNQWTAKDDKIEVGDEVRHDRGWMAVVTQVDEVGLSCVDKSGAVASYSDTSRFRKTGRHFDIQKILEEMRHD